MAKGKTSVFFCQECGYESAKWMGQCPACKEWNLEVQALVCHSNFGIPRRTAAGTDYNRVNLLMAVLEKRLGLKLGDCDAYVNIAG